MKAKTSSVGKGLISPGGDMGAYLGHFRSAQTMKRGHNQGAPGGMMIEPGGGMRTPNAAARAPGSPWAQSHQVASAQRGLRQAQRSGGDVAGARSALGAAQTERKADVGALKAAQKGVRVAKRTGGDVEAAKAARGEAAGTLKSKFAGAYKNLRARQTAKKKKNGGGMIDDAASAFSGGLF